MAGTSAAPTRLVVRGVRNVAGGDANALPAAGNGATGHAPYIAPAGPSPWWWLGIGLVGAFAAQCVLPGQFTWFLAAIPHEMGHATAGCLLGRPAAPAISLAGHAWTGIQDLRPALVWLLAAGCAAAAGWQRAHRARAVALAAAAVAIPALAFTGAAEVAIAAAGHVGELAFAAWCYAVCWHGGYTGAARERIAGAAAGALLQFTNLRLCFGLLTDAGAREHYASSGSLGLKNDYLVLAEDLCDCRLQSVALCMFVLSVATLPLGLLWGRLQARARGD